MLLKTVFALLVLILFMVAFVSFKVLRAFRNLSEKRIAVYTAHMGELHQNMHGLRHGRDLKSFDRNLAGQFNVIASFPSMRKSSEAIDALSKLLRKRKQKADFSEIAAAEQVAEQKLVELTVSMREDLALNTGNGRFPNSEVFRSNRGKP